MNYNSLMVSILVGYFVIGARSWADIVLFENPPPGEPGHYDWHLSDDLDDPNVWLDVTRPSVDQPGQLTPSTVTQHWIPTNWYDDPFPANISRGGAEIGQHQFLSDGVQFGTLIDQYTFVWGWDDVACWAHYVGEYVESAFSFRRIRYAGIRFYDANDDIHYGWIALRRTGHGEIELDVLAWAYESVPDLPIIAGVPAPATLAVFLIGVRGFSPRRRTH